MGDCAHPGPHRKRRLRVELIALATARGFSLVYKPVVHGATGLNPNLWFALDNALPGYLDQFAIGMQLAVASVWFERIAPRRGRVDRPPPVDPVGHRRDRADRPGHAVRSDPEELGTLAVHYLDTLIALGLFLPAVFGTARRGWVRRFLGHPVLIWIGVVSYGLYLYHLAVILQISKWGGLGTGLKGLFLWTVVCIGPALALAAASWYGVERTALRYKGMKPRLGSERLVRSGGADRTSTQPVRRVCVRSDRRVDRCEQRDPPTGRRDRDGTSDPRPLPVPPAVVGCTSSRPTTHEPCACIRTLV